MWKLGKRWTMLPCRLSSKACITMEAWQVLRKFQEMNEALSLTLNRANPLLALLYKELNSSKYNITSPEWILLFLFLRFHTSIDFVLFASLPSPYQLPPVLQHRYIFKTDPIHLAALRFFHLLEGGNSLHKASECKEAHTLFSLSDQRRVHTVHTDLRNLLGKAFWCRQWFSLIRRSHCDQSANEIRDK